MEFIYSKENQYQLIIENNTIGKLSFPKRFSKIKAKLILNEEIFLITNNNWFGNSKLDIENNSTIIGNINIGFWRNKIKISLKNKKYILRHSGLFLENYYKLENKSKDIVMMLSNHQKIHKYNFNFKIEINKINDNYLLLFLSLLCSIYIREINNEL